jgi:NTP pyrophosphatase (non-canonical NTP hydrolase)
MQSFFGPRMHEVEMVLEVEESSAEHRVTSWTLRCGTRRLKSPVGYNPPAADFTPKPGGPMSEISTLQRTVASFVEEAGIEAPVYARLLDLASEVGELSKEVLEGTNYGRAPFRPANGWTGELGDVLFALVCLANSTGVDLEAALGGALDRYRQRLALGDDAGSGR